MSNKFLSLFIDESGDFGPYEAHSPYYLISIVLPNQNIDISENIKAFDSPDLICTMELLAEKAERNTFTHSELEFFDNVRDFKKNYLKHITKNRYKTQL